MECRRKKIEIKLESDLLVSDGTGYNSLIDVDVCSDSLGFPYIPGKGLKGGLRESAEELVDFGESISVSKLFGEEGTRESQKGRLHLSNGVLKGRKDYENELNCMPKRFSHPESVLKQFTYLRTQTAIDSKTGTAKEGLRCERVVKSGCVFEAEATLLGENEEELAQLETALELCCKNFRHMGYNCTRGLGEVRLCYADAEKRAEDKMVSSCDNLDAEKQGVGEQKKADEVSLCDDLDVEKQYRLEYQIKLVTPLVIRTIAVGQEASLDYIPGSMMLGKLAGWMDETDTNYQEFAKWGEFQFANLYPAYEQKRMLPLSAAIMTIKNKSDQGVDLTFEREEQRNESEPSIQLRSAGAVYTDGNSQNGQEKTNYKLYETKFDLNYHHSRAKDREIGAVYAGDERSQFYRISSLSSGQIFQGYVQGSGKQIKIVEALMRAHRRFYMGYNASVQYGEVELNRLKPEEIKRPASDKRKMFVIKLESPLIEYDENGRNTTDWRVVMEELKAHLPEINGQKPELKVKRSFFRYAVEGGYQSRWHLQKPYLDVWERGTTVVCEVENGEIDLADFEGLWLGERVQEGYGEFSVYPISETRDRTMETLKQTDWLFSGEKPLPLKKWEIYLQQKDSLSAQILLFFAKIEVEKRRGKQQCRQANLIC